MSNNNLLEKAEKEATKILKQFPKKLSYHNYAHTKLIVETVQKIGAVEKISEEQLEIAMLAAWFQFTGYRDSYEEHIEKSKAIAASFLSTQNVPLEKIEAVQSGIAAEKSMGMPTNVVEKILLDASRTYILKGNYKKYRAALRSELAAMKKEEYTDIDWVNKSLEEVSRLSFCTAFGKQEMNEAKEKSRAKLEKQKNKFQKEIDDNLINILGVTSAELKAMKKKLQKAEGRPERGIETMFRLTSKNHIDLSGMADSKANIMISVNSIILSILIGGLLSKLDTNPHLVAPTIILLAVNLASMICSIISIRPNVTNGLFTREDIENQKTNLLFFGNFHKMNRDDYHWGMNQLMSSSNFLYSSLIDDIYFLGVVLAKKYKFLRYSYNIFMIGIVVAVVAFVIANFMAETVLPIG